MIMSRCKVIPKVFFQFLIVAAVVCALVRPVHGQNAAKEAVPTYADPSVAIDKRVDDLVSRMTLEEKVFQMQHTAPAIPRLGIPSYDWWSEALHGIARSGYATVFPQAIGMAATWDTQLVHREAEVIATETRAKYNQAQREGNHSIYYGLTLWSPNINIFRDPRWGRGQETYGEDPFLTAKLGVAFVTGLQGNDPKYLEDGSHAQALRRAQRTGEQAAWLRCRALAARPRGYLPSGISRHCHRRARGLRDVRL